MSPAAPSSSHGESLKYLFPGWYAVVMGLAGLALAWQRAVPFMGKAASAAALGIAIMAAVVFVVLTILGALRGHRHPGAWAEDLRHPVRHTFVATLPVALILLATCAVAADLRGALVTTLWWVGSLTQLLVTVWVLSRWWRGNQIGGLQWASVTPALYIPIVGNVLVPLAGVPLGQPEWAAAQFGIGLLFWPVVTALLVVRIAVQGMWPERLLPASVIFVAPPAAVGLSALQFGASHAVGWGLWGMALFSLLWVAPLTRRIADQPFGLAHWGMTFPLAAFAALTLRLAPSGPLSMAGIALLALISLLVVACLLATVRGLRDGRLLAAEPAAGGAPASAAR
jgi:tellurite resistance protein